MVDDSSLCPQAQSYPSLNPGQNNGQARQTNEAEQVRSTGLSSAGLYCNLVCTVQVSMEEFLESCRATSLLAELEDEEELPDAEVSRL